MHVFELLADPTRRRIVELLAGGERTGGNLCSQFEISQPAISGQLRVLRENGMVSSRPRAQQRLYRLEPRRLAEIDRWLERYREFWAARLDELGDVLGEGPLEGPEKSRRDGRK